MILLFIPSDINEDWNRPHAILTVLVVLYACVFVEMKSVFETSSTGIKNVEEIQKLLLKFFENKEDIKSFISFLYDYKSDKL